jgi:Cd2+/Zn2+-exporting ATPase
MINTDPNHKHTYDEQGRLTCCSLEEKIYAKAGAHNHHPHDHEHDDHDHDHGSEKDIPLWKQYLPIGISSVMLIVGIFLEYYNKNYFYAEYFRLIWYGIAYLLVGFPVMKEAFEAIRKKQFFTEFTLMVLATIGAFAIDEYPEGVTVMLFYSIGELFQGAAVRKAQGSVKALLDQRPDEVNILANGKPYLKKAETVIIGEIMQLLPGMKLALDGELVSERASFNTAALTGESKPDTKYKGESVLAGMINENQVCEVKVTNLYEESKLSKILNLIQEAAAKKAPTELFIRKFSKIYTPIVFLSAVLIVFIPFAFSLLQNSAFVTYNFNDWLYRALIFLVVSCPCALIISIPLGYFGGIGAGSRNGILFKGSSYLDLIATVKCVVMDKTGTLTKGVFKVQEVNIADNFDQKEVLHIVSLLESKSTHPIAKAIMDYGGDLPNNFKLENAEEIIGHGLKGVINGKEILVGNFRLMEKFQIGYNTNLKDIPLTTVIIAVDRKFAGYLTISDEIKEDAREVVEGLNNLGIETVMLSGDKTAMVNYVADQLKITKAYGDLLPQDKVIKVKEIKDRKSPVAFVGDGINDAPVIALSDIGIAMGGLGSDAAIETADVVIQNDRPSKILTAIKIGKATKKVVLQNISLAFGVKVAVLIMGAGGIATMWEAVFADVGVALLAILNAMRIQNMKF